MCIGLMECSRSSRKTPASSRGAFKRLGADAAKMSVAAGSVVERFDVVEDIAAVMSLVQSARMNGHDPYAYLKDVLTRLPTHRASRIEELLPHRWQGANA